MAYIKDNLLYTKFFINNSPAVAKIKIDSFKYVVGILLSGE